MVSFLQKRWSGPGCAGGLLWLIVATSGCSQGGADHKPDMGRWMRDLTGWDDPEDLAGSGGPVDLTGARDLTGVVQDLTAGPADLSGSPVDLAGKSPCTTGGGWTAFRFVFDGSTSARTEVFGLPDRSNWQAGPAFAATYEDALHGGGVTITSGNFLLVRFSLDGISRINSATLSVFGRSYNTTASGSFRGWSPLYGDISSPTNSVSNAWPYKWTSVDYTANVRVGDNKNLTAFRLHGGPSSGTVLVKRVELCIDGG